MFKNFVLNPLKNKLKTPSGKIEITSETIKNFKLKDCKQHPSLFEPYEWLGNKKKFNLHLISNQPEFKLTFDNYFSKVVSEYRIKNAKIKLKENQKILNHISNKYNVQSRFIISLWGIESNFGNNMGDFNILQSLITLSYDGRRSQYFRKELIAALKILDRKDIHPNDFKGSWAGAMGQCQFMPSTYLKFAKGD